MYSKCFTWNKKYASLAKIVSIYSQSFFSFGHNNSAMKDFTYYFRQSLLFMKNHANYSKNLKILGVSC